MINSPLYGLRILHYLNLRYDTTGRFQSEFDSNYKVVEKNDFFFTYVSSLHCNGKKNMM